MSDSKELSSLIRLLEDETVRPAVMNRLAEFGNSLEDELENLHLALTPDQAQFIRPLLDRHYRDWLAQTWGPEQHLEEALGSLARFQLGRLYPHTLRTSLDNLADEYDSRYTKRDALSLAEFLFQGYGLRGAEQNEYYNPLNSNLVLVIERRRGIPISLACIYILVGERLELKIEGCNFPGHFLAVASTRKDKVIVDCFNGGTFIDEDSLATAHAQITREDILRMRCNSHVIIARVLRNLINAYQRAGEEANAALMNQLLVRVEPEK